MEGRMLPSAGALQREVSAILHAAQDPYALTFKQVRLGVEESFGVPEGSLHKDSKPMIRDAVHSVLDEMEGNSGSTELPARNSAGTGAKRSDGEVAENVVESGNGEAEPDKKKRKCSDAGLDDAVSGTSRRRDKSSSTSRKKETKAARKSEKARCRGSDHGADRDRDDGIVCVLSETERVRKQVSIKTWKGSLQVDIREYYNKDAGEFAPGRKGITLNASQWEALVSARSAVDEMIERMT